MISSHFTKTIDNQVYQSQPETIGCQGCAADNALPLCRQLAEGGHGNLCAEHDIIWVRQEDQLPKTLEVAGIQYQQAPVEGNKPCNGCVAQLDTRLCNQIGEQHNCLNTAQYIWIKPQPVAPDYTEVLSILQEECAEVIQAVSKVRRFGFYANHPQRTTTNQEELEEELGDLLAMIELLTKDNFLNQGAVQQHKLNKINKLQQYSKVWK